MVEKDRTAPSRESASRTGERVNVWRVLRERARGSRQRHHHPTCDQSRPVAMPLPIEARVQRGLLWSLGRRLRTPWRTPARWRPSSTTNDHLAVHMQRPTTLAECTVLAQSPASSAIVEATRAPPGGANTNISQAATNVSPIKESPQLVKIAARRRRRVRD